MDLPEMPLRSTQLLRIVPPVLASRTSDTFRTTLHDDYDSEIDEDEGNSNLDSVVVFDDHTCITLERRTLSAEKQSNQDSSNSQIQYGLLAVSNAMLSPERDSSLAQDEVNSDLLRHCVTTTALEEFADTELVNVASGTPNETGAWQPSKPKRRLSGLSNPFPNVVKRARIATSKSLGNNKNRPSESIEQATDDWFVIVDVAQIPSYSPSDIMAQRSARRILSTVAAQAKAATRTMGKLKRKYNNVLGNPFPEHSRGPTKCVAVGMAC